MYDDLNVILLKGKYWYNEHQWEPDIHSCFEDLIKLENPQFCFRFDLVKT